MSMQWPSQWGQSSVIVEIDKEAIPLIGRLLERIDSPRHWLDQDEWLKAYKGLNEIRQGLMAANIQALADKLDAIYRLIDSVHNGRVYTAVADPENPGRYIYSPVIPIVPDGEFAYPGERAQLEHIRATNDNLVSGQTYPAIAGNSSAKPLTEEIGLLEALIKLRGVLDEGWFGIGGQDATLASIVKALRAGDTQDEVDFRNLANTAKAATTVETLQDALTDFMSNGLLAGKDAAIGLTQLGGQLGIMTMLGLVMKEVMRVRAVLHPSPVGLPGDPIPVPPLPDTIIGALRGNNPASATNNVVAAINRVLSPDEALLAKLLDIEALLT